MTDREDVFPILEVIRCLGLHLRQESKRMVEMARIEVTKYLHAIKGKIRKVDLEVK